MTHLSALPSAFVGPPPIKDQGTVDFLPQHLNWPK